MDMKKNCFLRLMNVVMMATMCVTSFTACGGDDDDDILGSDYSDITIGSHRIDVEFEGNTIPWTTTVGFSAVKASASGMGAQLYENGQELSMGGGSWSEDTFRSYSISTDDRCQTLCCVLYVRPNTHSTTLEPITIRMRGYVNGNLKKERSFTVDDNNKTKIITFFSEINEGDNVQEFNY